MARVLVADDSGTMRKIICRSLAAVGLTDTVQAADGLSAIELFKAGGIHLVLTDWNMPGKNGVEAARAIRTLDKQIPILMVTTEAEKARVLEAIQAGVTDYLVKPFTTEGLQKKLERFAL
jgi:two-component system, chemotaxis family, chemotaxis protein CheY